ncbi:unnamed protein product, partial [marine sediment metagenome]
DAAFNHYRLNDVASFIYDFVWSEYCDWYLEFNKTRLQLDDVQTRETAQAVAVHVLRGILALIHPFAPHISEELWQYVKRDGEPDLIVAPYPDPGQREYVDYDIEQDITVLQQVITSIRSIRADMGVDPGKRANLSVRCPDKDAGFILEQISYLRRLAKVDEVEAGPNVTKPPHAATAVVEALELFIPLEGLIDLEVERERLLKRIHEMEGRLAGVQNKLDNEAFLQRAPAEVVAHEREKQSAYQDRLNKLKENYQALV